MAQRTKRNQNVVHTGGGVGALAGAGDAGDKKDQGLVAASVMDTDIVVPGVGAPAEAPPLVADDSTKDNSSGVKNWSVDEVVRWAKQATDLDDEDLEVLRKQKVKGKYLEGLTKEELREWGMAGAPAKYLLAAIDTLLGRSSGGGAGDSLVQRGQGHSAACTGESHPDMDCTAYMLLKAKEMNKVLKVVDQEVQSLLKDIILHAPVDKSALMDLWLSKLQAASPRPNALRKRRRGNTHS